MPHIFEMTAAKKQLYSSGDELYAETLRFELWFGVGNMTPSNTVERFQVSASCAESAPAELQLLCAPQQFCRQNTFSRIPGRMHTVLADAMHQLSDKFGHLSDISETPTDPRHKVEKRQVRLEFDNLEFTTFLQTTIFPILKKFVSDAEHVSVTTPSAHLFCSFLETAFIELMHLLADKLHVFADAMATSPLKRKEQFLTALVSALETSPVLQKRFEAGLDPTVEEVVSLLTGTTVSKALSSRVL